MPLLKKYVVGTYIHQCNNDVCSQLLLWSRDSVTLLRSNKNFLEKYIKVLYTITLQKNEICAQLFALEKFFKICFVYVKRKPKYFIHFSFWTTLSFTLMNALFYFNIDQGIHKGKTQSCSKWKMKKILGFSFYINIGNFEAFFWNLSLSANHLFWRCVA